MLHLDAAMSIDLIWVKISPEVIPATLALLEDTWRKVAPETPFAYAFLDEVNDRQYQAEERWSAIVSYAAGFAIIIACLGLFGLAALMAIRRTKEIGIRKTLGATVTGIVGLLSKDFVKLVLIANLVAWPVAYYAMNKWLQNFAYRIKIGLESFLLAAALAAVIAMFTISFQAIKAALTNPVEALRYE
jgi:putative ABC transport system permease protein